MVVPKPDKVLIMITLPARFKVEVQEMAPVDCYLEKDESIKSSRAKVSQYQSTEKLKIETNSDAVWNIIKIHKRKMKHILPYHLVE